MTGTPVPGPQAPSALARFANARLVLFANQIPGVLDSPRTGRFLFEAFLRRLRQISSKDNSPGADTGDFSYEGFLTRGALLPLKASHPWDWLDRTIAWCTAATRPLMAYGTTLLAPCGGVIWLSDLAALSNPGRLAGGNRAQLAAFSVTEFGGLHGPGGIGAFTQPLLGKRITASLKPNRVAVIAAGDTLNVLAERHGTTVATLRSLNLDLTQRPSDPLPVGIWLLLPRRRAAANADTSTTALPSGFHTPESLAAYLCFSLSTIYSWNSSGYCPSFVKLGNLVRCTYEDVELWLARQIGLSRG